VEPILLIKVVLLGFIVGILIIVVEVLDDAAFKIPKQQEMFANVLLVLLFLLIVMLITIALMVMFVVIILFVPQVILM
jgi:hypothetical protein